ncbi:MAG: hypothetical protein K2I96_04805 [Lachnospiraceae bacterium]|nr:hypothetical protein [Lachnospiraceae bacterium]
METDLEKAGYYAGWQQDRSRRRLSESAGNFKVSWGKKAMYEKRAVLDCNNQKGLVVLV